MFSQKVENFFKHWPRISQELKHKDILFFSDYDGTLLPIVDKPELAILGEDVRILLDKLSKSPGCQCTIVSGRSLLNLKKLIDLKKLNYVGNHGFEILGPNIRFENTCFPRARKIFDAIIKNLEKRLKDYPGVLIEDKSIIVSIHYRLLDRGKESSLRNTLYYLIKPYLGINELKIHEGKKVLELRPYIDWDKGKAVLWLIKEYGMAIKNKTTAVIYIGDDQTDEDAFFALKDTAITIHVGGGRTRAQYYLESPKQVKMLLKELVSLKENKSINE